MIIREVAMRRPGAVCCAAEGRRTDGEGVAYELIAIDPNRMGGLSCIRDTRVTVRAVLGQLAAGLTFPSSSPTSRIWTGTMCWPPWSSPRRQLPTCSSRI